jgi:hypothetical protein
MQPVLRDHGEARERAAASGQARPIWNYSGRRERWRENQAKVSGAKGGEPALRVVRRQQLPADQRAPGSAVLPQRRVTILPARQREYTEQYDHQAREARDRWGRDRSSDRGQWRERDPGFFGRGNWRDDSYE